MVGARLLVLQLIRLLQPRLWNSYHWLRGRLRWWDLDTDSTCIQIYSRNFDLYPSSRSSFNLNSPFALFSPSLVVFTCNFLFCFAATEFALGCNCLWVHNMYPNFIVRRLSPILTIPSHVCGSPRSLLGALA